MKEYIDKENVIDIIFAVFASHWKLDCSSVDDMIQRKVVHTKNKIKEAPAADVVEHKRGEWVGEADGYADGELVYDVWYCSECNHCIDDGTDAPDLLPNFCPNCGADMREVDHEGIAVRDSV